MRTNRGVHCDAHSDTDKRTEKGLLRKSMRILIAALMLVMMIMLAACSSTNGEQASDSADATETATAEDGQNPIMNFIGKYGCDRAGMLIEADGMDGAKVTVTWSSSAFENSEWVMTGSFDPDTLTIEYHDCVRTDYVYEEGGEIASSEEVYTGGHGFIKFNDGENLTLTWQDDQEHIADDMVFTYAS